MIMIYCALLNIFLLKRILTFIRPRLSKSFEKCVREAICLPLQSREFQLAPQRTLPEKEHICAWAVSIVTDIWGRIAQQPTYTYFVRKFV